MKEEFVGLSSFRPDFSLIRKVRKSSRESIGRLAKIAGLDPSTDFKNSDLRGADWFGTNVADFDRAGSLDDYDDVSFDIGDYVVYPKHGVGRVIEIQSTEIAGVELELYVLRFQREKMTLRVPTDKAESVGIRRLSSVSTLEEALATLKGQPEVKRIMWSRRAQEYERKINSGDLVSIAEVVRDLFSLDATPPEQSYSERQLFEAAASRLACEFSLIEEIEEKEALKKLSEILHKAASSRARRRHREREFEEAPRAK